MNGTSEHRPIWMLGLVFRFPYGGWVSGALIFLVLYSLFKLFGDPRYLSFYATIFFCGMVAYIIPVFSLIISRSLQAFDALQHLLDAEQTQIMVWRKQLGHRSLKSTAIVSVTGVMMGLAHLFILEWGRSGKLAIIIDSGATTLYALGTLLIWLFMTTVISVVMENAVFFHRLGRDHLRIDLLHVRELVPLGWVSVISTLTLIGAQIFFGLLILDNNNLITLLPGFLGTAIPMLPMFLLPMWSVHIRLQKAKAEELAAINRQLVAVREESASPLDQSQQLDRLHALLVYRREIINASEWPFDLGTASRLGLYLIIPPLTWVGAALIENLVEETLL